MKEAERLDKYADSYTRNFPHFEENRITHVAYGERIGQYIRAQGTSSALSLGIGHTEVARRILSNLTSGPLKRYVIVDAASEIIERFRGSLGPVVPEGLELVEGFFETFVSLERFDVIEAGFVLEHVNDPALVLSRLHQFLTPGGRVFIAVPNARSLHRVLGHKAGLLEDIYVLSPSDLALGHKRYFDLDSISELVRAAGFKVAKTEGLLLKPFTTGQLNMLNLSPVVWQALLQVSVDYPGISNAIYLEATA
jgi:SAM-dependent methyltransferase